MKPLLALLLLSLGLNVSLVLYRRSELPPQKLSTPTQPSVRKLDVSWHALDDFNLPTFVSKLRAAGVPTRFVKVFVSTALDEKFREKEAALSLPKLKLKFWQKDDRPVPMEMQLARLDLQREKSKLLNELLGPDGTDTENLPIAYKDVDPAKRDAVRMIKEDYETMLTALREQAGLYPLPAEKEQIAFLEKEKQRELSEQLSPEEIEKLEIQSSALGQKLAQDLRDLNLAEGQFRVIYAAQKRIESLITENPEAISSLSASDARLSPVEEIRRIKANLRAAIGEETFSAFLRSQDADYRRLSSLVHRAGYPAAAVDTISMMREQAAAEGSRIYSDTTLSRAEQVAAFRQLAANLKLQMNAQIGTEATSAYAHASPWFHAIEQAQGAIEFNENGFTLRPVVRED